MLSCALCESFALKFSRFPSSTKTGNAPNSSLTLKRWMMSHFMDLPVLNSMVTSKVYDYNLE